MPIGYNCMPMSTKPAPLNPAICKNRREQLNLTIEEVEERVSLIPGRLTEYEQCKGSLHLYAKWLILESLYDSVTALPISPKREEKRPLKRRRIQPSERPGAGL